jgi:hypothetical protein
MDSPSQSPQSEMRGPPNTIPESTEHSISSAINVKKPLLQFVKKVTQNKRKHGGGSEQWLCSLCNHVFKGSYTRVYHHLLAIPGDGVKICTCPLEKRIEMTTSHGCHRWYYSCRGRGQPFHFLKTESF